MNEQYDVIVIGGGVAGLSTAANITEGKVLVLEKERIKTKEKRHLRFTFLNSMARFGLSNCICARYNVLSLRSLSGSTFDFEFDDFEMSLLDLGKINSTLKKHIEKTQEVRERTEVFDITQSNHGLEVEISRDNKRETISTKYLVDASGNSFFTRRKFNLDFSDFLCACLAATFKGGYIGESQVLTFILPTSQFQFGGWLFPFDTNNYEFGVADGWRKIISSPINKLHRLYGDIQKHPALNDIIQDSKKQEWDTGIVPVGISYPLVFNRICYVGDTVGQATPWYIEGVRPILETSIMCAQAINASLKRNDKSLLSTYQKRWDSIYGEVFQTYNYKTKWTKNTKEWEMTSVQHTVSEFKRDKTHLLDLLRYDKMSEKGQNYLRTITAQFSQ
jgi:flavin-dependent dehydrogenase